MTFPVLRFVKVFSVVLVVQNLNMNFSHYGQLGIYHCPNCGFKRPDPDYTTTNVVLKDELYSFDMDGMHIQSTARTPYNIYNTLSAYVALRALHAPQQHFQSMIESFDYGNNREDIFNINGARVQLHLSKNPIGFQQKGFTCTQRSKTKRYHYPD